MDARASFLVALDAEWLGERVLLMRTSNPGMSASERADAVLESVRVKRLLPKVLDKAQTLGDTARVQYQAELAKRAEAGDKYAISALRGEGV